MKAKTNSLAALETARDQLQAAIKAGEASEKRFAELRVRKQALEAETAEPPDPLDTGAVQARAAALTQAAAIESELQGSEAIRQKNGEAIRAALQGCAVPVKEIVNRQARTMSGRLEDFLVPFCKDRQRAVHLAGLTDGVQYLNSASGTWWANESDAKTGQWVLAQVIGRLLSDRPTLWPDPPPKLVLSSAALA